MTERAKQNIGWAERVEVDTEGFSNALSANEDTVQKALDKLDQYGGAVSPHNHVESDITDLDKYSQQEVDDLLLGKAAAVHNHDGTYSPVGHTHDGVTPAFPIHEDKTNLQNGLSSIFPPLFNCYSDYFQFATLTAVQHNVPPTGWADTADWTGYREIFSGDPNSAPGVLIRNDPDGAIAVRMVILVSDSPGTGGILQIVRKANGAQTMGAMLLTSLKVSASTDFSSATTLASNISITSSDFVSMVATNDTGTGARYYEIVIDLSDPSYTESLLLGIRCFHGGPGKGLQAGQAFLWNHEEINPGQHFNVKDKEFSVEDSAQTDGKAKFRSSGGNGYVQPPSDGNILYFTGNDYGDIGGLYAKLNGSNEAIITNADVSESAVNSTIPIRSSSGYIYGKYFNATATTNNGACTAASLGLVYQNPDGFYRTASFATVGPLLSGVDADELGSVPAADYLVGVGKTEASYGESTLLTSANIPEGFSTDYFNSAILGIWGTTETWKRPGATNRGYQFFTKDSSNILYFRNQKTDGTAWEDWKRIYVEDDNVTYKSVLLDAVSGSYLKFGNVVDHNKIRLWTQDDRNSIGMSNAGADLGSVTSYATTFTMNNVAGYGWLWRDHNNTSLMSLDSVNGHLTIAGSYYSDKGYGQKRIQYESNLGKDMRLCSASTLNTYLQAGNVDDTGTPQIVVEAYDGTTGWLGCKLRTFNNDRATFAPTVDAKMYCGDNTYRWISIHATNGTIQTSDERLKDFEPLGDTSWIYDLEPKAYRWKDGSSGLRMGFSAQQALTVAPKDCDFVVAPDNPEEYLSMNMTEILAPMLNEMQKMRDEINKLKEELKNVQMG